MLRERFAEIPSFIGLVENGAVLEVFTSNDGATWTIVVTKPDGMSSVVAAGEFWESVKTFVGQPI